MAKNMSSSVPEKAERESRQEGREAQTTYLLELAAFPDGEAAVFCLPALAAELLVFPRSRDPGVGGTEEGQGGGGDEGGQALREGGREEGREGGREW